LTGWFDIEIIIRLSALYRSCGDKIPVLGTKKYSLYLYSVIAQYPVVSNAKNKSFIDGIVHIHAHDEYKSEAGLMENNMMDS